MAKLELYRCRDCGVQLMTTEDQMPLFPHHLEKVKATDIHCNFCGGELGDVQHQPHDNPNFAEYRVCLVCDYEWAKEYWAWLAREQGVKLN